MPARIDEYVGTEAAVRVIDAFVGGLDMVGLGFVRGLPAATGRPGYDPRDLLKLYVYGYINEVRSSRRRLERECRRNVEVMWLLRRLVPDFKTIADFRRDNGPGIVGTCRAFVLFCRKQRLFVARLVALDGSKFRAAASAKRVVGREIAEEVACIDRRVADYLAELDAADAVEPNDSDTGRTAAALAALRTRRAELDALAARLQAEDRTTLVEGEPDNVDPTGTSGIGLCMDSVPHANLAHCCLAHAACARSNIGRMDIREEAIDWFIEIYKRELMKTSAVQKHDTRPPIC